jgi:branched-subunit amino acid transport protein
MNDITLLIIILSLINIGLRLSGFILTEKQLQQEWANHINRYAPGLIFFCLALFSTFGNTLESPELWKTIPLTVATITHIIGKNMIITLALSMLTYALVANYLVPYLAI